MDLEQFWQSALGQIELQVSRPNFLTWLKHSRLLDKQEGIALVSLPNTFARDTPTMIVIITFTIGTI